MSKYVLASDLHSNLSIWHSGETIHFRSLYGFKGAFTGLGKTGGFGILFS